MEKTYKITIYNDFTKTVQTSIVSKEVFDEYRRGIWRIAKNDAKHRINEILISDDGNEGEFSNFQTQFNDPEDVITKKILIEALHKVIAGLKEEDLKLIQALYFEVMTEQQYADCLGVKQQTIHKKKLRILKTIKKLLE